MTLRNSGFKNSFFFKEENSRESYIDPEDRWWIWDLFPQDAADPQFPVMILLSA